MSTTELSSWRVNATLNVNYEVRESVDVLDPDNPALLETPDGGATGPRLVIVDTQVARHYGARIENYLSKNGVAHQILTLDGDEPNKTMGTVFQIVAALNATGTLRVSNPPIAIGGGVLLDVVGLAANLYRRGIPHIRVPTTLLSLVDVSVAAKTGVNFQGFRNRLGSYSPPPLTLIDSSFLATLPQRHLSNGAGEILKMGMIKDISLFELLESHGPELLRTRFQNGIEPVQVIRKAIRGMHEELKDNLWEKNLRRCVDYGHSFSPLIEMSSLPDLLHGEAVAIDCVFSAVLAHHRGYLREDEVRRVIRTAKGLGLRCSHPKFFDPAALTEALEDTVRHRNGAQNLPVMAGIGEYTFLNDVTPGEIERAARGLRAFTLGDDTPLVGERAA
ncbi:sedoheptulose 7-phosphate cyclase [Streptomyces sp. CAU 1734]|uniref:sedoheptulose 7-phosphate cyclase n=1 Tax=Streptomyces sp. CAU 1734 TaxID=3140360 RepID=UPI0032610298